MGPRGTSIDANAALALDAKALESLKAQAAKSPEKALSQAAGQFEALFVSMVLKSMRDALPQDGPLASETTKTYTAMFDQQLALKLADRGIGLRKTIEKQLARALPAPAADAASTPAPASKPVAVPGSTAAPPNPPPAVSPSTQPSASNVRRALTAYATPPAPPAKAVASSGAAAAANETSGVASTVGAFVDKLKPYAERAAKALGVPVQFLLAQAGLETGWGKSQPKAADGASSHNLFGVKAGRSWSGRITQAKTTEYNGATPTQSTEAFRSYGSYAESFQDFVKLLKNNQRYADALSHSNDASGYAKSLQRAGYATDPAYAQKLTRAIALVNRHTPPAPAQVIAGGADTRTDSA